MSNELSVQKAIDREQKSILQLTVLEFINSFSLLVVLGSASTAFFFSRFFQAELGIVFYWLLSSTVWVIYTVDHLIDGTRNPVETLSLRHYLHYRYRVVLSGIVLLIIPVNTYLAIRFLSDELLVAGLCIAGFVVGYLLLILLFKKLSSLPIKEALVSLGVTAGMCLLPAIAGKFDLHYSHVLLLLVFTLINFLNLLIFSLLDEHEDKKAAMPSIVQYFGSERSTEIANNLVIATFFLMGIWLYTFTGIEKRHATVVLMLMLNILALILLKREYFEKNNLFRFWGDSIYLVPGLIQALFVERII